MSKFNFNGIISSSGDLTIDGITIKGDVTLTARDLEDLKRQAEDLKAEQRRANNERGRR